jgi:EAL domain-containing protein (putative c-di-GMP-specific phosphodiesterase class I)
VLKIDRAFVDGAHLDPDKAAMLRSIVEMASSLHLDVIAEGIEQPGDAALLRAMRPLLVQGFLFSRPLRPDALVSALRAGDLADVA